MPPPIDHIRSVAEAYLDRHRSERDGLSLLFDVLGASQDPTHRKTFPAHVTCSAIVIDSDGQVLHIVHKATGKLLAPGGHNEPGDHDLLGAALRELYEEVGVPPSAVGPPSGYEDIPLDIDVHAIDADPLKDEPAHHHIDFRWAFYLRAEHAVTLQKRRSAASSGGRSRAPPQSPSARTSRCCPEHRLTRKPGGRRGCHYSPEDRRHTAEASRHTLPLGCVALPRQAVSPPRRQATSVACSPALPPGQTPRPSRRGDR
jgi:8-oxo-dGTP pyrophosphatase MutT (NUDIX family)